MSEDTRQSGLPTAVCELIARLGSFERVEVLMQVHRRGSRPISASSAAVMVGLPSSTVSPVLELLHAQGFLARGDDGAYVYQPSEPALDAAVAALAHAYAENRALVLAETSASTVRRARGSAARTFADAFVIRPKKEPGDG